MAFYFDEAIFSDFWLSCGWKVHMLWSNCLFLVCRLKFKIKFLSEIFNVCRNNGLNFYKFLHCKDGKMSQGIPRHWALYQVPPSHREGEKRPQGCQLEACADRCSEPRWLPKYHRVVSASQRFQEFSPAYWSQWSYQFWHWSNESVFFAQSTSQVLPFSASPAYPKEFCAGCISDLLLEPRFHPPLLFSRYSWDFYLSRDERVAFQ